MKSTKISLDPSFNLLDIKDTDVIVIYVKKKGTQKGKSHLSLSFLFGLLRTSM
jgi:hypothetical protein